MSHRYTGLRSSAGPTVVAVEVSKAWLPGRTLSLYIDEEYLRVPQEALILTARLGP